MTYCVLCFMAKSWVGLWYVIVEIRNYTQFYGVSVVDSFFFSNYVSCLVMFVLKAIVLFNLWQ